MLIDEFTVEITRKVSFNEGEQLRDIVILKGELGYDTKSPASSILV